MRRLGNGTPRRLTALSLDPRTGEQRYLDTMLAYQNARVNAIPNSCATLSVPTASVDVDRPGAAGPTRVERGQCAASS